MELKIIASTQLDSVADKNNFDYLAGISAGISNTASKLEELRTEDIEKTNRRIAVAKEEGDERFFKTSSFSIAIDGLPRILGFMLQHYPNIHIVDREGRYVNVKMSASQELIYNKWVEIFKNKIIKLYKSDYPAYFSDAKIKKLAHDNARYLTSVFATTDVIMTANYVDLNRFIAISQVIIAKADKTVFEDRLAVALDELVVKLKDLPYYDEELCMNYAGDNTSIFADNKRNEEYYADVYSSVYNSSWLYLDEALDLGGVEYKFNFDENDKSYYIPEILSDSPEFAELWLSDIKSLGDDYFPMATLLEIEERGTLDNFLDKLKSTKCTHTQLELNKRANDTLHKYEYALRLKVHPRAEDLIAFTHGSKCKCGYECKEECEFGLGVDETRRI